MKLLKILYFWFGIFSVESLEYVQTFESKTSSLDSLIDNIKGHQSTVDENNCDGSCREGKINGGDVTSHKFHSYQVRIVAKSSFCGGSILDDYHIISAAHCFIISEKTENKTSYLWKKEPLVVEAGTTNFNEKNETERVISSVQKVYVPKIYIDSFKNNDSIIIGDIAVLKLETSLNLTKNSYLKNIRLPENDEFLYINKTAIVSGYGAYRAKYNLLNETTGKWNRSYDGRLRFAKTRVLSNSECQKNWDLITIPRGWPRKNFTSKHLCAQIYQIYKQNPKGICNGDSGGPLIYLDDILIGVANTTPAGCNEYKLSGTYARVSAFKNFIEKVQNDNGNLKDSEILITTLLVSEKNCSLPFNSI